MPTLTLRTAVLGLVLPLALAACGTRPGQQTATDPQAGPTSPAAHQSTSAPARHVDPAAFLSTLQNAARRITTARFSMTMAASGQRVPVKGVLDLTGDSPAVQMTLDLSGMGTPSSMRLVDKVVYLKVPGTTGTFYKMDLSNPNGPLGSLGGGAFDSIDPGSMMSTMSPRMFQKVTDHGVAVLHGQQLHYYTVLMDVQAATKLAHLPGTVTLPRTATYDVWLDGQGRLVRFRMVLRKSLSMSATYSEFGTAPHVVAPPAADVQELPSASATG